MLSLAPSGAWWPSTSCGATRTAFARSCFRTPQRHAPLAAEWPLVQILSLLLPERPYRALFRRRLRGAFAVADPFWLRFFDSTVAGLAKADLLSRVLLASEFLEQTAYGPRDLERWPGRILILDADDDPLTPPAIRATLRALYPQAEVHAFSGTGHSAAILHPERYAEVIRRFLLSSAAERLNQNGHESR